MTLGKLVIKVLQFFFVSNRSPVLNIPPHVYGLSNAVWPELSTTSLQQLSQSSVTELGRSSTMASYLKEFLQLVVGLNDCDR